jgi:hypothetical protein
MAGEDPVAELAPQFSSDDATPTPWVNASKHLEKTEVYWLSTARPDGRAHVTSLLSVWLDGALYFCTGYSERAFGPAERSTEGSPRNVDGMSKDSRPMSQFGY